MRRGAALALAALALLAGCPGDPHPTDAGTDAAPSAQIVMGLSAEDGLPEDFTPYAPTDTGHLVPGVQGLQHVYVALRGAGFDPTQPRVEIIATRVSDGLRVGYFRVRLPFAPSPTPGYAYGLPRQQIVIDNAYYCSVLGADLHLELNLDDGHGHQGHQAVTLHIDGFAPDAYPGAVMGKLACCAHGGPDPDSGLCPNFRDAGATD